MSERRWPFGEALLPRVPEIEFGWPRFAEQDAVRGFSVELFRRRSPCRVVAAARGTLFFPKLATSSGGLCLCWRLGVRQPSPLTLLRFFRSCRFVFVHGGGRHGARVCFLFQLLTQQPRLKRYCCIAAPGGYNVAAHAQLGNPPPYPDKLAQSVALPGQR